MAGVFEVAGAASVDETGDGRIAIWAADGDLPHALVVDRPGALETAQRLTQVATGQMNVQLGGDLRGIQVIPPQTGDAPGRLIITADGPELVLWLDWENLRRLAEVAQAALRDAPAGGSA